MREARFTEVSLSCPCLVFFLGVCFVAQVGFVLVALFLFSHVLSSNWAFSLPHKWSRLKYFSLLLSSYCDHQYHRDPIWRAVLKKIPNASYKVEW